MARRRACSAEKAGANLTTTDHVAALAEANRRYQEYRGLPVGRQSGATAKYMSGLWSYIARLLVSLRLSTTGRTRRGIERRKPVFRWRRFSYFKELFRRRRHGRGMVVNNEPFVAVLDVSEAVARWKDFGFPILGVGKTVIAGVDRCTAVDAD